MTISEDNMEFENKTDSQQLGITPIEIDPHQNGAVCDLIKKREADKLRNDRLSHLQENGNPTINLDLYDFVLPTGEEGVRNSLAIARCVKIIANSDEGIHTEVWRIINKLREDSSREEGMKQLEELEAIRANND